MTDVHVLRNGNQAQTENLQQISDVGDFKEIPRLVFDNIQAKKQFTSKLDNFVTKRRKKILPVFYQWTIIISLYCDEALQEGTSDQEIGQYKCNPALNRELELKFRQGTKIFTSTLFQNRKLIFDLEKNVVTQPGKSGFKYTLERRVLVAGRYIKLPKHWNPTQTHTCQLFEVGKATSEFKNIEQTLKNTLPGAKVTAIQRIQNLLVYQKYYAELPRVEFASNEVNEKFLFHGTRNISPGAIISCQEGFDTRLAGNQNLWGPAAYFAEDAKYVDAFAYKNQSCNSSGAPTKQIIVASVALGACFDYGELCNPSLKQPPINIRTKQRYNSVSGVTKDSRVYAVFNSAQCCPRYIVNYE